MAIEQALENLDPHEGETEAYINATDVKQAFIQTYNDLVSKAELNALWPDGEGEVTKTYVDAGDQAVRDYVDSQLGFNAEEVGEAVELLTGSEANLTLDSGVTDSEAWVTRHGNLVTVSTKLVNTTSRELPPTAGIALGTIPSGFIPTRRTELNAVLFTSDDPANYRPAPVLIATNGVMTMWAGSGWWYPNGFVSIYSTYRIN